MIERISVWGSPNIGVYMNATDAYVLLPSGAAPRKVQRIEQTLKVKAICHDIGDSKLLGALVAANSKAVALPYFVEEKSSAALRRQLKGVEVAFFESRMTALKNLILLNDKGVLVSPEYSQREVRALRDIFALEVAQGTIGGMPNVGALAVATNSGALVHPNATEEEKRLIAEVLKVPVGICTVNNGIPYVSSGLVANSYGALVGQLTTGPEIMMISKVLE